MKIQSTDDLIDFSMLTFSDATSLTKNALWCDITVGDEELLYIQMPKCTTKKGIVVEKDKRTCELMYEVSSNEEMLEWFNQFELQLCHKIHATHSQWISNTFDLHTIKLLTSNILNYHRNGKFVLIKTNISDEILPKTIAYDESQTLIDVSKLTNTDYIIPIITINGITISPSGFEIHVTLFQFMILEDTRKHTCMINKNSSLSKSRPLSLDPLPEKQLIVDPLTEKQLIVDTLTEKQLIVDTLTEKQLIVDPLHEKQLIVDPLHEKQLIVDPLHEKQLIVENLDVESLSTVPLEISVDYNEIEKMDIKLSSPDKYKKTYTEAKTKADKLRQEAITAFQEAERIRLEYSFYDSDSSE